MSAIARYFRTLGMEVSGYDRTPTQLTSKLQKEGIQVFYDESIDCLPEEFNRLNENNLVVYTPAIPTNHKQLNYLKDLGYTLFKRSEILGMISKDTFTIAVAGTHGKTTTTAIIAHILKENNKNFTAFLGGISTNYETNFIRHEGDGEQLILVEADEYDRSFLRLFPNIAVITSVDADHLDIYGQKDELLKGFKDFVRNIDKEGQLILNNRLDELKNGTEIDILTYGLNQGQFFASDIIINDGFFIFDLYAENSSFRSLTLGVPGFYNIENALAALAVSAHLGVSPEKAEHSLRSFAGVKRRFEFIIRSNKLVFIDDYAHHPAEIESFLISVRELFRNSQITAIFQPHLFSRTRDFADDFGKSLSLADRVILMEIYPAREEPIEGVNSAMLLEKVSCQNKELWSAGKILSDLRAEDLEVVVTIGAGDIDKIVQPLKEKWSHGEVA